MLVQLELKESKWCYLTNFTSKENSHNSFIFSLVNTQQKTYSVRYWWVFLIQCTSVYVVAEDGGIINNAKYVIQQYMYNLNYWQCKVNDVTFD